MKNKKIRALSMVFIELVFMAAVTAAFLYTFNKINKNNTIEQSRNAAAASSAVVSSAVSSSSAVQTAAPKEEQLDDWKLILVNYDHKMPDDYKHVIVHELGIDIDSRVVEPYKKMRDAALKDKIKLWISSAYRSPEKQQTLFEQEIRNYSKNGLTYTEALSKAESSVARAGYSEHNTGLAMDLNGVLEDFGGTPASNWLQKHSAEYGFVLRYPADKQSITKIKYEPWHFRYVGEENAKEMNRLGMCLEEYVDYLGKKQKTGN